MTDPAALILAARTAYRHDRIDAARRLIGQAADAGASIVLRAPDGYEHDLHRTPLPELLDALALGPVLLAEPMRLPLVWGEREARRFAIAALEWLMSMEGVPLPAAETTDAQGLLGLWQRSLLHARVMLGHEFASARDAWDPEASAIARLRREADLMRIRLDVTPPINERVLRLHRAARAALATPPRSCRRMAATAARQHPRGALHLRRVLRAILLGEDPS